MGLFSGAASILNTESTNAENRQIARETNASNLKLAQMQNAWNVEQWEREVAYNDPSAQAKRLTGAGMSQAAAAQSVANTPAPNLQSADLSTQQVGAPMVPADFSAFNGMNIIGAAREIAALKKESAEADVAEAHAETELPLLMTKQDVQQWTLKQMMQTYQQSAELFPYKKASFDYDSQIKFNQIEAVRLGNRIQEINYDLAKQRFDWTEKLNEKQLEEIGARIDEVLQRTKNLEKEGENLDKQGYFIEAQTDNTRQDTKLKEQQTAEAEIEKIFKEAGSPETTTQRIAALVASGKLKKGQVSKMLLSAKDYLNSGGYFFNNSLDEQNFFDYVLHEGNSKKFMQGIYTTGALSKTSRKQFIPDFSNYYDIPYLGPLLEYADKNASIWGY